MVAVPHMKVKRMEKIVSQGREWGELLHFNACQSTYYNSVCTINNDCVLKESCI